MKIKFILPKILQERGISKNQFAKDIGVSYPTLDELCKGKTQSIKFYVLENICNVLKCTPNDLFEYSNVDGIESTKENPIRWHEIQTTKSFVEKHKNKYVLLNNSKPEEVHFNVYTKDDAKKLIQSNEFQEAMQELLLSLFNKNKKDDTE